MSDKQRIDLQQLHKRCSQSIPSVMSDLGGEIVGKDGLHYAYKDNGASILSVAHTDTVQQKFHFKTVRDRIYCPMLDDRLGVYTVMDLMPSLGINMDILLTEGEESFMSTARIFQTEKKYNWIVEFDRHGNDVATYQYDWEKYLDSYFVADSHGTYTDIVDLGFLECKGLNVGVGYEDEHSLYAYFSIGAYVSQINRFLTFYKESKYMFFPHHIDYIDTEAREYGDDGVLQCPHCGLLFLPEASIPALSGYLCPECGKPVNTAITETLTKRERKKLRKLQWRGVDPKWFNTGP